MVTTGATDGKVRIFDLRRRDCISSWSVSDNASSGSGVATLQPSHDDTSVYTMTTGGVLAQWSLVQTGQKVMEASVCSEGDAYFADPALFPRNSLSSAVFAFTSDERHILTCSTDGGDLYKVKGEEELEKVLGLKGHNAHLTCVDWSVGPMAYHFPSFWEPCGRAKPWYELLFKRVVWQHWCDTTT